MASYGLKGDVSHYYSTYTDDEHSAYSCYTHILLELLYQNFDKQF